MPPDTLKIASSRRSIPSNFSRQACRQPAAACAGTNLRRVSVLDYPNQPAGGGALLSANGLNAVDSAFFLKASMFLLDHRRIFDTRDHLDSTTACFAGGNINVENPFPVHDACCLARTHREISSGWRETLAPAPRATYLRNWGTSPNVPLFIAQQWSGFLPERAPSTDKSQHQGHAGAQQHRGHDRGRYEHPVDPVHEPLDYSPCGE